MKFFPLLALMTCFISSSLPAAEWIEEDALFTKGSKKIIIAEAKEAFDSGDFGEAADLYEEIVEIAKKPRNRAKATVLRGDSLLADGEVNEAFKLYQEAIDRYPMFIEYEKTVGKQSKIVNDSYEVIRNQDGIFLDRRPLIAMSRQVVTNSPFADTASLMLLRIAMMQMDEEMTEQSLESYRTLIKRYRTTAEAGYARVNIAQYYLHVLNDIDGDQRLIDEAKQQLLLFTGQFESHPMLDEAAEKLKAIYHIEAERLYNMANFYLRDKSPHYRPEAAKRYLYKILIDYPESDFVDPAKALLVKLDPDYEAGVVKASEEKRKKTDKQKGIVKPLIVEEKLPPEATNKKKRRIIVKPQDSDKYLLPVEDLKLEPLETKKKVNSKGTEKNEK